MQDYKALFVGLSFSPSVVELKAKVHVQCHNVMHNYSSKPLHNMSGIFFRSTGVVQNMYGCNNTALIFMPGLLKA